MAKLMRNVVNWVTRPFRAAAFRKWVLEVCVDYLIKSPEYVDSEEYGFNAQAGRKQIFNDLIAAFDFEVIIETGTWVGNTTGYMAEKSKLPVYTSELNDRFQGIAKMRLKAYQDISFALQDSRDFLRAFAGTETQTKRAFIYLDAHWYDDLPLDEELRIIAKLWQDYVIMIDDFGVPTDADYRFDNYGKGFALCLRDFAATFKALDLDCFFPVLPAAQETGKKRGCVILARGENTQRLLQIPTLAQYPL